MFWSGDNLVKVISKDDVSIHPSVILQLLIPSQRSSVMSEKLFDIYRLFQHPHISDVAADDVI